MKKIIKNILKLFLSEKFIIKYKYVINEYNRKNNKLGLIDKIKCILFEMKKYKFLNYNNFFKVLDETNNNIIYSKYFAYFIDFNFLNEDFESFNHNTTVDYSVILKYSLNDLKKMFKNDDEVVVTLDSLEIYLDKYVRKIKTSDFKNKANVICFIKNIKNKSCSSFQEALQRILFFNQIFWQLGYKLCGLGRLDYILDEYYNKGKLKEKDVKNILIDFLSILNSYYDNKSGCLSGDTGQIIILGGIDSEGHNFSNKLTYLFIDSLKDYNKPDPKLFLRVNRHTSKELIQKAIGLMSTGIGSPLLSNDDIIVPKLIEFGYDEKDSWNYVTAACWEPSPCGNSMDLNNIKTLELLTSFNNIFEDTSIDFQMEEILKKYFENLGNYIKDELSSLSNYKFGNQPYFSLFIEDCRKNGKTINKCDVKYKNLGITILGFSNVVNSIVNINKLVFENKILNLNDFNEIRKNNLVNENILKAIKNNNKYGYGSTDKFAVDLTNRLIEFISNEFKKYNTYYGGKFKFGLSAPSYVDHGKNVKASFDGRKDGESFNVHISSNYTTYLDIMNFASNIEYKVNTVNGNVIDFILTPDYIKNNIEKFTDYVCSYINKGIYQLQINVIDSKTLIKAMENPELYRNLIVRVWGFSAYFNDLPIEYKNLIISRAIEAERLQK